jgi:hypothetical protein
MVEKRYGWVLEITSGVREWIGFLEIKATLLFYYGKIEDYAN